MKAEITWCPISEKMTPMFLIRLVAESETELTLLSTIDHFSKGKESTVTGLDHQSDYLVYVGGQTCDLRGGKQ